MAYKKRGLSSEAETAQQRLQGILQIDPQFDFGNGLNAKNYTQKLADVTNGTNTYNGLLTQADGVSSKLDIDEKDLAALNTRMLNAVGSRYGYDSIEYEKAGGKRNSDIKHKARKSSTDK